MKPPLSWFVLCCTGLAIFPSCLTLAADATGIEQVLIENCLNCHSQDAPAGNFDMSALVTHSAAPQTAILEDRRRWAQALARIKFREMPPPEADSLEPADRLAATDWIQSVLKTADSSMVNGANPLRRLSRYEYGATLRDLLGIHVDMGQDLPADAAGGEGFDNAVETLFLSELHLEKYIQAADSVVEYVSKNVTSRRMLFGDDLKALPPPTSGNYSEEFRSAANKVLERFLGNAFRRPCTSDELSRYFAIAQQRVEQNVAPEEAILAAVRVALVSPNFLFRIEKPASLTQPELIDDYELASRLSYFLWSSMPDAELFALAQAKTLHQPQILRAQVDRMIKESFGSDRSDIHKVVALAECFMGQWLGTRDLGKRLQPDRTAYPAYNEEIEFALKREPADFFEHMLMENRPLLDLIDSDYSFMTRELVDHYGLTGQVKIRGWGQMHRVNLPENSRRGGILGMGAVMAVSSYSHRTSPVLRGKWLLETFLDSTLPPPPPNIPNLDAVIKEHPTAATATLRQRLEQHRADATCATCHDRLDPLGFALENYDVTGKWRDTAEGQPIDPSALMTNGEHLQGPLDLKAMLMERKLEFARVVTTKMLGYAMGRGLTNADHYQVEVILERLEHNDFRTRELIYGIVESGPFLHKSLQPAP